MTEAVVIGFDTATEDTAVGATRNGEPLFEASVGPQYGGRPQHAAVLLPEIERAAAAAGGWERVERVAVGVGPGSFTGLRIGIATARALAQGLGLQLAPVSTLAALARGLAGSTDGSRPLLPLIDGRRGEVFAALFDAAGEQLWPPFVSSPEGLLERLSNLNETPLAGGDGALRFRQQLVRGGAEIPDEADPVHHVAAPELCAIGARAETCEPSEVTPLYLRQPDAERWRVRDN
jgi:tRNA threonylcarbamoyladenosine biosynthesis protein TsaB